MSSRSRYTLIKGKFHIFYPDLPRQGPEPDGDTITFEPDNLALIKSLTRFGQRPAKLNLRHMAKIRFEGIDALETHFPLEHIGVVHQQLDLAFQARDYVLNVLGFKDVLYWDDNPNKVKSVRHNPRSGYILANGVDSYGRVIAFVFPDDINEADGTQYFIDSSILEKSVNYQLIQEGLAYAELYSTLPLDLANLITEETRNIRSRMIGIWPNEDVNTKKAATIDGINKLEEMVMWPKLFRRLSKFFDEGYSSLEDFKPWLREDPVNRDDMLILPNRELGNLHDLFSVTGNTLKLKYEPEEVIILPH